MAERPVSLGIGRGQPGRAKDRAWRADAACRGNTDDWYPAQGDSVTAARARKVCNGCPVRLDCLVYAIVTNEPFGIFGGCTERERRHLRAELVERHGLAWLSETTRSDVADAEGQTAGAFLYLGPDIDEVLIRLRRRGTLTSARQAG